MHGNENRLGSELIGCNRKQSSEGSDMNGEACISSVLESPLLTSAPETRLSREALFSF